MNSCYYVYILASFLNTTFYVGVTNDLVKRTYQHKKGLYDSFTKKYKVNKLVYFEEANDINIAIKREKQLKRYRRSWKVNLIRGNNKFFDDLSKHWFNDEDFIDHNN
jgi:putative endonuclease